MVLALGFVSCGPSAQSSHPRLPTGVVDAPTPNQTVKGPITASGWAISDDGIKRVSVYVDLTYLSDASYGASRPDVKAAMSTATENVGWTATLNVPPGKHELVFQAETTNGAIRDVGIVPVTVVP